MATPETGIFQTKASKAVIGIILGSLVCGLGILVTVITFAAIIFDDWRQWDLTRFIALLVGPSIFGFGYLVTKLAKKMKLKVACTGFVGRMGRCYRFKGFLILDGPGQKWRMEGESRILGLLLEVYDLEVTVVCENQVYRIRGLRFNEPSGATAIDFTIKDGEWDAYTLMLDGAPKEVAGNSTVLFDLVNFLEQVPVILGDRKVRTKRVVFYEGSGYSILNTVIFGVAKAALDAYFASDARKRMVAEVMGETTQNGEGISFEKYATAKGWVIEVK